jgi:hypothetical protein
LLWHGYQVANLVSYQSKYPILEALQWVLPSLSTLSPSFEFKLRFSGRGNSSNVPFFLFENVWFSMRLLQSESFFIQSVSTPRAWNDLVPQDKPPKELVMKITSSKKKEKKFIEVKIYGIRFSRDKSYSNFYFYFISQFYHRI